LPLQVRACVSVTKANAAKDGKQAAQAAPAAAGTGKKIAGHSGGDGDPMVFLHHAPHFSLHSCCSLLLRPSSSPTSKQEKWWLPSDCDSCIYAPVHPRSMHPRLVRQSVGSGVAGQSSQVNNQEPMKFY
jgi:hypothetical protein